MNFRILVAIVFPLLAVAQAWAQEDQDSWYDVEIILFEKGADTAQEVWTGLVAPAELNEAVALASDTASRGANTPALLSQGQLKLTREAERIEKRRNHKLLAHFGWRQPGLEAASAPRILILPYDKLPPPAAATPGADLPSLLRQYKVYGSAKFIKSRYLHLDVDVLLNMPAPANSPPAGQDAPETTDAPTLINAFRLKESRRMRSQEIHYFDHPRFGLIAMARPVKAASKAGQ